MSNTIDFIIGDACRLDIKNSSIDLIITSPPYAGVDSHRYGGDYRDQINSNPKTMLKLLVKSTKEMSRVLKKNGSILINIGHNDAMPYRYISEILKHTDLKLVGHPFIWYYNDVDKMPSKEREKFNYSYGFWFHLVKDINMYHNPFAIKKYSNPIWKIDWNEKDDVVKQASKYGFIEDSFNSEIAKRFIEMFTKLGANVLDPFGGSGVTAIEAYKSGRNGISIDISKEQTKLAKKRFEIEIKNEK